MDESSLSVAQLRKVLQDRGVDYSDCFEKADLIKRVKQTEGAVPRPNSSAPPSRENSFSQSNATPRSPQSQKQSTASAQKEVPNDDTKLIQRILRTKDFYDILAVKRDASEGDIKKAYRRLALRLHPDKCTLPGSEDAFKQVSRAFDVLGDEKKRQTYDRHGAEAAEGNMGARPPGFHGAQFQQFDAEEIFRAFFAGQGGPMGNMGGAQFHTFNMGGMGGMGGPRASFRRQQQNARQQQERGEGSLLTDLFRNMNVWMLLPMMPLILMAFQFLIGLIGLAGRHIHVLLPLLIVPAQYRRQALLLGILYMMMH